jgi:L-ascorbate metabolism protein UlaG (beta-lactamase superfamily)
MTATPPAGPSSGGARFRTLGHASLLLEDETGAVRVVADPWHGAGDGAAAALAVVTHGHADHCSEEDLLAATAPEAPILAPRAVAARLDAAFPGRAVGLAQGDSWSSPSLPGVAVAALPAEGPPRAAGFHPRGEGLAWLVTIGAARFLVLGDSAALVEHEGLAPDVAFFAVGDFTVMTPDEAADAAARIRPRLAVPVHWGDTSARFEAARRFVALATARGIPSVPLRGGRQSHAREGAERAPRAEGPCSSTPSPTGT